MWLTEPISPAMEDTLSAGHTNRDVLCFAKRRRKHWFKKKKLIWGFYELIQNHKWLESRFLLEWIFFPPPLVSASEKTFTKTALMFPWSSLLWSVSSILSLPSKLTQMGQPSIQRLWCCGGERTETSFCTHEVHPVNEVHNRGQGGPCCRDWSSPLPWQISVKWRIALLFPSVSIRHKVETTAIF